MTPLDALKAGVKTAVLVFAAALVGIFTTLAPAVIDAVNGGKSLDLSNAKALGLAALGALGTGVVTAVVRYVQVVAVPGLSKVLDKVFGKPPVYPEATVVKSLDSTAAPEGTAHRTAEGAVIKTGSAV